MTIKGWIRQGDKTACGATVIEGDEHSTSHGRPHAFKGARISCRKKCIIAEGLEYVTLTNGKPRVVHGMKTSGGCPLMSTLIDIDGVDNASNEPIVTAYFQPAKKELAAALANEPWVPGQYDDRYVLVGISDGNPLANAAYAIEREDGSIEHGTTDAEGHTHLLKQTLDVEHVRIYLENDV